MFRIALKSLLGHKLRMFLTAISIIIGVSFVAGSYIFTDSMSRAFDGIFEELYSQTDAIVSPKVEDFGFGNSGSNVFSALTVSEELAIQIGELESVNELEGSVLGQVYLIDENGDPIGNAGFPTIGFSWEKSPKFNSSRIDPGNGRPPSAEKEVVVDVDTAEKNELVLGESVQIQTAGEVESFTIVGITAFGSDSGINASAGVTFVGFDLPEARRVFGIDSGFSRISISANSGVSQEQLKAEIEQLLPDDVEVITGEQGKSDDLEQINEGLGFLNTALLSFAGISIFVGAFIIQNTFRIVVAQRSKELALLRAVGATRRQIRRLVTYEALIIGIFASGVGILVGIGISAALRGISGALGISLPSGSLAIEPRTIYVSLGVGVIITVLSALLPAIRASRVSPVEAMRDIEASKPLKSLRFRAIVGLMVAGVGTASLLYGLFADVGDPIYFVGFGAGVMFLGISVIAPLLSRPIATVLGLPITLYYRMIGRIAERNAKRSPRRTASTAAALMIGVSLVVFATVFASSIKATVDQVITDNFPGDVTISSKLLSGDPFGATFPASVSEDLLQLDEVELVSKLKYDFMRIDGSNELVVAVEPETFADVIALDPVGGNYDALMANTIYVYDNTLEDNGWSVGDTISVEYAETGENTLTIVGQFSEPFDSPYLISSETYFENFSNRKDLLAIANISDGFTIDEGKQAIERELENYPIVQAQDKNELVNQAREQIDQVLGLLSALLGFAVIIAMLGITNTLTLSVAERTREIGMLRAIGMTRAQVRKMIRAESIIIAVFGALLGMAMGIFFSWAILQALEDIGLTAFSLPVVQLVVYLIVAVLAGILAAVFPSYKASRMNILNAINYE